MTLLAPLFLFGGLAVALPILLHLRRRTAVQPQPFPSLMFLAHVPVRTMKRRRLRDVALLVAYADNECVGYQGLLAGLLCHKGAMDRVHWSTAFYVAPDYRGQGVAARLLGEVKNLNVDFPVTRMTDNFVQIRDF